MRVAFDIDGVLADIDPQVASLLRSLINSDLPRERSSTRYDQFYNSSTTPDPRMAIRMMAANAVLPQIYDQPEIYQKADPYKGGVALVRSLARMGYFAGFVTHRAPFLEDATMKWLEKHIQTDQVHTVVFTDPDECKSEACRSIDATVLVEDNLEVARKAAASGMRVFLIDRLYNQGELPSGVSRVADFPALAFELGALWAEELAADPSVMEFPEAV